MRRALFISSFKRAVSVLVLLALVLGGVFYCGRALRVNDGYYKNTPFLEDDREYDVLFFGTSHMVNSVFPMQLWKETGITSYNLAIHGGSIASSYWMLQMALEYQKPKVAVMDVLLAKSNYMQTDLPMAHAAMDPFPLSETKLRAIWDIYPDTASRAELLFPLDIYHNRWKELDTEMLRRGFGESKVTPEKGGESRIRVYPLENPIVVPETEAATEMTEGLRYLQRFIELCQQEGILPVITYLPYRGTGDAEEQRYSNAAIRLAQSLGAATVDLQHTDLIDDDTDWYDDGGHTNPTGAKKITAFLGQYLKEHYDLADHSGDADWAGDYEKYLAYQEENIREAEELWSLLTVLSVEDFTATVEISEDFAMDPVTRKLLDDLGDRLTERPLAEDGRLKITAYGKDGEELVTRSYKAHNEPIAE